MLKNELFFERTPITTIASYAERMNDELKGGKIGYYHLPEIGANLLGEIAEFEATLSHIKSVVLVGIGGSSLGVKALKTMLPGAKRSRERELYFLDNVDAFSFERVCASVKFDETLFVVSSKSGTTIETITLFKCILARFDSPNLSKNFIVITDPASPLEVYARQNGVKFFNIPKNVGGRFSVLSAIGLVPLMLCGYDAAALLEGARACKRRFLEDGDDTLLQKAYHYATHKNAKINVVFSYGDRFL